MLSGVRRFNVIPKRGAGERWRRDKGLRGRGLKKASSRMRRELTETQKGYHLCLVGQWLWELMYLSLLQIQNSTVMSSSLEDGAVNQQHLSLVPPS